MAQENAPKNAKDLAASVSACLLNIAKAEQTDFNAVLAEKLHAMVLLGMTNSRVKDYLDVWILLERESLDATILATAIAATFKRRATAVPTTLPIGLSDEFANDTSRQALWAAFLRKNDLAAAPLGEVVTALRDALQPALVQAALLDGA